ncbi:transporter [Hydrocarboniclastica marina]|uniref:Transporter n=1 Tax=Hydrocarboniclastica marina TaxID=2259620 RepID=A0A4P7XFZ8_9ALTE|nr:transporter [Hydrocarboniclastica marina]MAL98630.1 flagellar protein FilC [Alteromonadaceae bacterium]QCF25625.1 transporter [Hydrocarboniclastica marina]
MKPWVLRSLCLCLTLSPLQALAQEQEDTSSVDEAREALSRQEEDEDTSRQLEEVFQAAEENYSLLKAGSMSLKYSFDYDYTGDQRIDLELVNNSIRNLDVTPSATHKFTNSFSFDYGLLNNVTLGVRVPFVVKYDTQDDTQVSDLGDLSFTTRWQPLPYVPGTTSITLYGSLNSKTGVSPYEIDINRQLSTGSGYYTVSGGASLSKVLDPVVIYGSVGLAYSVKEEDVNQVRGSRLLDSVEPGFGLNGSAGFAYSLSYDISLSASVQVAYNDETVLEFSDGSQAVAQDQMTGIINFSLGTRVSETTIINTNVGFGLTEDAPDFSIGVSLPINLAGLKE